jgi:hypothetical protein
LLIKHKALSSNLNTIKKERKGGGKGGREEGRKRQRNML